MRTKRPDVYKDQRVYFYIERGGFWKLGTCYKEDKKWVNVRDLNGKRYRVPNDVENVKLFIE